MNVNTQAQIAVLHRRIEQEQQLLARLGYLMRPKQVESTNRRIESMRQEIKKLESEASNG